MSNPSISMPNTATTGQGIQSYDGYSQANVYILTAVVLAFAVHHFALRKGEWHLKGFAIFQAWILSYPVLYMAELIWGAKDVTYSAVNALIIHTSFTIALLSSITIYRLFFHRLNKFPGPKMAAVSKSWHCWMCSTAQNHLLLEKLRKQYGNFVRTGPTEITIFEPDALAEIDGSGSHASKSVFYDILWPDGGVVNVRNQSVHDQRRRIWVKATSSKVLPIYQQQMVEHSERLERLISVDAENGHHVCFTDLAYWLSFDIMGTFMLSESFGMIHNKEAHWAVDNLRRAMKILGVLAPAPWVALFGFKYFKWVGLVKDWHSMVDWCRDRLREHINLNDAGSNIISHLIADSIRNDTVERDFHTLTGDAVAGIVAGSDTVAPTTVMLFYELASHPQQAEKLFQELQGVDITDHNSLEKLPHLNGLINETLRLHPAVPTGGNRDTPSAGMVLGGRFIPGNTTVVIPRYSIFRSEKCYKEPSKFIPERWYSRPEMVINSKPFRPFSSGRYSCVGKALAFSQLRIITSILVSKYHVSFPPGFDTAQTERDFKDQFTAAPGKLNLMFTPRV